MVSCEKYSLPILSVSAVIDTVERGGDLREEEKERSGGGEEQKVIGGGGRTNALLPERAGTNYVRVQS